MEMDTQKSMSSRGNGPTKSHPDRGASDAPGGGAPFPLYLLPARTGSRPGSLPTPAEPHQRGFYVGEAHCFLQPEMNQSGPTVVTEKGSLDFASAVGRPSLLSG